MSDYTPQVGDTITTGDIRALPGRTILLFHGQVAATPFVWLSDAEILIPPLGADEPVRVDDFTRGASFTIAYLPGHPPRPEREVAAEALREVADDMDSGWINDDDLRTAGCEPGVTWVEECVAQAMESALLWEPYLRARADRIARGDVA